MVIPKIMYIQIILNALNGLSKLSPASRNKEKIAINLSERQEWDMNMEMWEGRHLILRIKIRNKIKN